MSLIDDFNERSIMSLSVIIPAYNEVERLPKTLQKVREYLSAQKYDWEVLMVNDGSTDNTYAVLHRLIKDWPEFRLIDNRENKGKGAVVKQGMLEAKGDWRLFMDADGSTAISELDKLWQFTKENPKHEALNPKVENSFKKSENSMEIGKQKTDFRSPNRFPFSSNQFPAYEVIIGSRYLKADSIKIKQPFIRRIVSRLGNILVRLLLGIKAADTQCGFKLFSKEAAEKIFPLQTIDRWGFDMEILAIAIKKGYKIKEVPVDWYDAEGSQVKKSAAFKTLRELLQIKWNILKGLYHKTIK